jgi:ubiquinone/menaquinone biosynthesis C-methylase UbiE
MAAYQHLKPARNPIDNVLLVTISVWLMSVTSQILMRMFGQPRGYLGRCGGIIMAHTNDDCAAWVIELLEVKSNETVLEVGFGPGVAIKRLSEAAGHVTGIDQSREMITQAEARNANAIKSGRVELRHGSVSGLPFVDNTFHKAMAVNSMQIWPDTITGLREMWRVMKSGGTLALGFTPYSGQKNEGLTEKLIAAGFTKAHVLEKGRNFCALATKP